MSKINRLYNNHKNGIIITLIFHILIFVVLNISQFNVKQSHVEAEILIAFDDFEFEQAEDQIEETQQNKQEAQVSTPHTTNIASNLAANETNDFFDEDYLRELEQAQNLVRDVSTQLSREIPTFNDIQIPEETTEGMDPDSIMNKLYSGNSNVEYFLENRYHVRLPIPVYLSQHGGRVRVNILVDRNGQVTKAEPVIETNTPEQLLSYAKTAALRTRFNPSNTAETRQQGYIIYTFIAQ